MTDIFTLQNALASAVNNDPVLQLAHLTAWLDPLWLDDDDIDLPQDEDDTLRIALHCLRRTFPDIYFEALMAMRTGATYQRLDDLICTKITAQGIPLESIEWMGYGVPIPAYGATLDDPDFYAHHPDTVPILACFGISLEPNPYNIDVPDCAYSAGHLIADDLQNHTDDNWRQVGWLIAWLFSCSSNTAIDADFEMIASMEPLMWEPDEIGFAQDLIEEADGIMTDALAGLAFINRQPDVMAALQNNVRRIYKATEKQKGKNDEPRIRLAWPHLAGGTERAAESVT